MSPPMMSPGADSPTDMAHYAVWGNPIGHSLSPFIHAAFAVQTKQQMRYEARLAPLDGFSLAVQAFFAAGGKGCNVTLPFKEQAFALATERTARAMWAGAANTLWWQDEKIHADNTDGVGLIRDLAHFLPTLKNCRVLILGAGGAVRGIIKPLQEAGAQLSLTNRNEQRAEALAAEVADFATSLQNDPARPLCVIPWAPVVAGEWDDHYDLIINGTSAGVGAQIEDINTIFGPGLFRRTDYAYDLQYRVGVTPFCRAAQVVGVNNRDGLGMLLEQAAESFLCWRGVRPDTAPVMQALRARQVS